MKRQVHSPEARFHVGMVPLRAFAPLLLAVGLWPVVGAGLVAQGGPAPAGGVDRGGVAEISEPRLEVWLEQAEDLLDGEDPIGALTVFRQIHGLGFGERSSPRVLVGTGRSHLLLGRPGVALDYADAALAIAPTDGDAWSLRVRALLRARRFDEALTEARTALGRVGPDDPAALAALASAMFRNRMNDDAASLYREVLRLEPDHPEAHLRLGSGLTPPRAAPRLPELERAVAAERLGDLAGAQRHLRAALRADAEHPIAHRLLGEVLFARAADEGLVGTSAEFAALRDALPDPEVDEEALTNFLPDYADLSAAEQRAVRRAVAPFRQHLGRLLVLRARHDLLGRLERTTDDPARASLRGRRTFDGRVWDDVRGVGGMRAATGVEALDEALAHGFDTLAHEIAHQVHFYGFDRRVRVRISKLYKQAQENGRFLDYYAASNDAEYFAQGVEAFVSYGKRPTREATHGHTRFELMRRDPELHALIDELVDFDPLDDPRTALPLLRAALDVAIRCGRPEDAVTAARLMPRGREAEAALERARYAELTATCW
jgi:tetratricopeptide (TPR) repeat protein